MSGGLQQAASFDVGLPDRKNTNRAGRQSWSLTSISRVV